MQPLSQKGRPQGADPSRAIRGSASGLVQPFNTVVGEWINESQVPAVVLPSNKAYTKV
jgi:hypothetical protein